MAAARLFLKLPQWAPVTTVIYPCANIQFVRDIKHWAPKWKKLRSQKVMKVDLPDYHEDLTNVSEERQRSKMKQLGLQPMRQWMERSFTITCSGAIMEPYVPPEGDGKMSLISTAGAKQKLTLVEKKSKSMMTFRKIRSYDDDFDKNEFANQAQDIYVQAHDYLINDRSKLISVVTERCYPEMIHDAKFKTIRWKFLQSLEPPRVVHARHTEIMSKENLYAQVTVRFHTQQILAVYDRFGRLIYGSEILAKDVLEYVVFEKHLSNLYGTWRMHGKIIPDWTPPREPAYRTSIKMDTPDVGLSKSFLEEEAKEAEESLSSNPSNEQSKLVTA